MLGLNARGKRIGRIAFGAVLLLGTAILVHRLATVDGARAAHVIEGTWAAAFAAYAIAGRIGSRRTLDHADELAIPGLAVPCIGVALLLPLTLQLPIAYAATRDFSPFDTWAGVALVITGPTHVAFGSLVGVRARQLARGVPALAPMKIFAICVAVSCLPFALLVLPPFLVMMTGIPMLGFMAMMEPLAMRDRLHAAAEALPRATLRRPRPEIR